LYFRHFNTINCAFLLICSSPLWSSNINTSAGSDFFEDGPLVLTASRMSKPLLEAPATVSIINRDIIEASGVRDVSELFRLVPGFIVGFLNGNTPVVSYHGNGGQYERQMQVLIDGRSVFVPSFGGIPWSNLPLLIEDIERIEVIRGPNAVTYGANAFLATINIITRDAAEDIDARYSVTASDNANPNIKDAYVRHGYHVGDLDWRLSAGTRNDEGFINVHDSKKINTANFRLDLVSAHNQFWTFQLGGSDSTAGTGSHKSVGNGIREQESTNIYFNLQWEAVGDTDNTILKLTHTLQEVADQYNSLPFALGPVPNAVALIDESRKSDRTDVEVILTEEFSSALRLVYGAGFRHDKIQSPLLDKENKPHYVNTGRFFGGVEWRINKNWLLDFGTSVENSSLTELEYSPRLSIIRNMSSEHALRLVISKAKRNPLFFEVSAHSVSTVSGTVPGAGPVQADILLNLGNPNIKPENILSYEIGLRSQLSHASIGSDIKLFTYTISDQIINTKIEVPHATLGINQAVQTYINSGKSQVSGVELSFDYHPITGLTFQTGLSLIEVESNVTTYAASFSEKTGFLHMRYHLRDRHHVSASYYYLDEVRWIQGASVRPAFNKLDLRYAYTISQEGNTQIEIIGQNLLEEYSDYRPENIAEKIFFLRLSSGF
jgi:iron complex outermembrane receptor protein